MIEQIANKYNENSMKIELQDKIMKLVNDLSLQIDNITSSINKREQEINEWNTKKIYALSKSYKIYK